MHVAELDFNLSAAHGRQAPPFPGTVRTTHHLNRCHNRSKSLGLPEISMQQQMDAPTRSNRGLLPNVSLPWFGFNLSLAALVTRDQGRAPRTFSCGDDKQMRGAAIALPGLHLDVGTIPFQ